MNGKRKHFWSDTEKAARRFAADHNQDRNDYGLKITLTAEQRFTLIQAEEIASRHPGATILEGMRRYDAHLKELSKTVPFSVLATEIRVEYKRRIEAGEVRGLRHVETLNETLKKLEARFGETPVSEISKEDLERWLKGLRGKDGEPLAAKTRNKHRGYTGRFLASLSIRTMCEKIRFLRSKSLKNSQIPTELMKSKVTFFQPERRRNFFMSHNPIRRSFLS